MPASTVLGERRRQSTSLSKLSPLARPGRAISAALPKSRWPQTKARVVVGMATFFDGYDTLMLGLVMTVLVTQWHLSNAEIG